jgi:hypothetical protein
MPSGWRPYTWGQWVATDLGWTWISYWPWGWAPFHYGRWTYHPPYGWVWIPGTVWAPAWVAWRSGHGWVGWAPLPPQAHWRVGFGLELSDGDLDALIVINAWSFVGERDFLHPRVRDRLAPLPRNAWLTRETRDATRYGEEGRHVVVRGPEREQIERSAGAVEVHRLQDVSRPPNWSEAADRTAVRVYRPEVTEARPMPKPVVPPQEVEPRPMPKPTAPPQAAEPRPMPKPTAAPQAVEPKPVPKPTAAPQAVEPPAKTPPPSKSPDVERRQSQEARRLEQWAEQQRDELNREQRKERKQPPPGESPEAVEQRQKAERDALAREVAREKELLDKRQQREAEKKATETKPADKKPREKKPAEPKPPPG